MVKTQRFLNMMNYRAFKVTALDNSKLVAEYIFDSLKAALSFHHGMVAKGYVVNIERL